MAAHLTEEEQIEALKRWWKDNGKFTVALILAAVLAWFGWTTWQQRQDQQAQQASSQYAELLAIFNASSEGQLSEEQAATARLLANELLEAEPESLYGNYAALILARLAVAEGDYASAETQLQTVLDTAANQAVNDLAQLRLARVLVAQEKYDQALEQLTDDVGAGFTAAFAELRGDVYLAQDQLDLAHTAYQEALSQLAPEQMARSGLLQLKLDNTAVAQNTATEAAQSPAAAEEGGA